MYSSYPDNARERRRRRRDARSRLQAVASFLIRSERRGLRISPHAQYVLENECLEVFKDYDGPPDTFQFATMLRDTAVRMFRQGRYKEANQRYRMASLFNPFDATLLSNRATCMYNLRRYRRCLEICELCFSAFPNLYYRENTGLHFQVLILLANAQVKLRNFEEALSAYSALVSIKDKLSTQRDTRVSITEAVNKLRRFEIDLEIARRDSSPPVEDPGHSQRGPGRPADFPYQEERGRFLHPHTPSSYLREINTGIDDYDLNSEEDGNPTLVVNVEHLCHHVYHMGMGACGHDDGDVIWQIDSDSCSDGDGEESEESFYFGDDSYLYDNKSSEYTNYGCTCGRNHGQGPDSAAREEHPDSVDTEELPDLVDTEELPDLVDADDLPDLVATSDDDKNFPSVKEKESVNDEVGFMAVNPFKLEQYSETRRKTSLGSSSPSRSRRGGKRSGSSRSESPQNRTLGKSKPSMRKFKNLLVMNEAVDALRSAQSSNGLTSNLGETKTENDAEYYKLVAELKSFVSKNQWTAIQPGKSRTVCDSDNEEPVSELDFSRIRKQRDTDLLEEASKALPPGNDTFLSRCTTEIFGSSFQSTGTLDFTRYFGAHTRLQSQGGKKKNKGCDRSCRPCFARRMWKLRFKSRKVADAQEYFVNVHNDDRVDDKNFLALFEWIPSGYYGSGYELANEHGILLHGVAFLILLQNEVCWQHNKIGFVNSIQKPFCDALLKNMKTGTDLLAISTLFDMFLETLNVIHCIKYQEWKGISRSPQFVGVSGLVPKMPSSSTDSTDLGAVDKVAKLMSHNGTATENWSNWVLAGHLAKEEEWVYHTLAGNIREVMLHFARNVLRVRSTSMPSNLNSIIGEVAEVRHLEDVLYRQRCRELEKMSTSRKDADLERGVLLVTRSIEAFPRKMRLYFRRADMRFRMSKWDACIRDLHKVQSLAQEQKERSENHSFDSEQRKSLLYLAILLEGDAHRERAKDPSSAQKSHVVASIDLYRRAMNMWSKKRKNRGKILQKIREQERLLASLEDNKRGKWNDEPSPKSKAKGKRKESVPKPAVSPQIDLASSSEEDEGAFVPGSRYGALLKEKSTTLSTPGGGQEKSEAPNSGEGLHSGDGGSWHRSKNGPSPEILLSEVRRILSLFGGEARSSDIVDNLDLTRWNIQDSANYITTAFGTLNSLCSEFGTGFEMRAGSQSDPVIALTNDEEFIPVSRGRPSASRDRQRNDKSASRRPGSRTKHSRSRSSTTQTSFGRRSEIRTSETPHYQKVIEDLLKDERDGRTPGPNSSELNAERDKECCICMDNPPDCLTIPCSHRFCEACILEYLARENTDKICPVCRSDITNVASMVVH
ncbi:Tetratricopeptide repeat containing protein [Gracilaria domingensis]|nr:Tetratricopeptide repeat containing protein [Gracilaria domingensis]